MNIIELMLLIIMFIICNNSLNYLELVKTKIIKSNTSFEFIMFIMSK